MPILISLQMLLFQIQFLQYFLIDSLFLFLEFYQIQVDVCFIYACFYCDLLCYFHGDGQGLLVELFSKTDVFPCQFFLVEIPRILSLESMKNVGSLLFVHDYLISIAWLVVIVLGVAGWFLLFLFAFLGRNQILPELNPDILIELPLLPQLVVLRPTRIGLILLIFGFLHLGTVPIIILQVLFHTLYYCKGIFLKHFVFTVFVQFFALCQGYCWSCPENIQLRFYRVLYFLQLILDTARIKVIARETIYHFLFLPQIRID